MAHEDLALVTGVPGWLGNRLLHYLQETHPEYPEDAPKPEFGRVRCLVLPGSPRERLEELVPGVELVEGDLRDPASVGRFCAGADGATLFHLGGLIHPGRVRELHEVNVEGTRTLIAAAAGAGVRRMVVTSSSAAAGGSRDTSTVWDEGSELRPYSPYGRSKQLTEELANAAQRDGALETVIVRPCWFYGPDQPARQTLFFSMIKRGKGPVVGGGEARRSMSYVDNTALGMLLAATQERAAGQTYWLADERPYTMNEITDTVEAVLEEDFGMQVAHKRLRLPGVASDVAYAVDRTTQSVGFQHQKVHVLSEFTRTIACSIDKARTQLGYRPGVDLREGMRRSVEWCLASGQTI